MLQCYVFSVHINYNFYSCYLLMKDNLDIHTLSMKQADELIQDIWWNLSEEEKKSFLEELDTTDKEYIDEIKELKKQIIKI